MTVHVSRDEFVATVTIDRPDALNALSDETIAEMHSVVDELSSDTHTRAVILTGAGQKAFVAGGDIRSMCNCTPEEARVFSLNGSRMLAAIEAAPQPWIAAINGFALGGGVEIALACDIRLAADTATFALPEVGLGIMPGLGGTQRLWQSVGLGWAEYLALSANRIGADEALRIGLVQGVCGKDELMPKAQELAQNLAAKSPVVMRYCKAALRRAPDVSIEAGIEHERNLFALCFASEDQKEGMTAFIEGRAPRFTGQ